MPDIKDWFTPDLYEDLGRKIKAAYPSFDSAAFVREVFCADWEGYGLFQRLRHSAGVMAKYLPQDYPAAVEVIARVLPQCADSMAQGLIFPEYVAARGLDDLETSLRAMEIITPYSSCEFAVRPFIEKYKQTMIERMTGWTKSDSEHIRRLASEGARVSIPWGAKLKYVQDHPETVLPLLANLMEDPSEYVRLSVANNLNEMSKAAPALVLEFCQKWLGKSKNTDKIIKHALRTLLKKGDPEALRMFGMEEAAGIAVTNLQISPGAAIGGNLPFSFDIVNNADQPRKIRIGYDIGYLGANGKLNYNSNRISDKVCQPGITHIERKHAMTETSARKLRPGEHKLRITINGGAVGEERGFIVTEKG